MFAQQVFDGYTLTNNKPTVNIFTSFYSVYCLY